MDNNLAAVYLLILLIFLAGAAFGVFRQILKTRRIEGTLARLQKKLTKEKGTAQEYYQLGGIYLDKKLYAQAIATFQKALKAAEQEEAENSENIALIYNGLGFTYFAQDQYDLAIRNYKEALKLDPSYVTALNNLGHAYERKNLTAQALQVYEQALQSEPKNSTAQRRAESLRKRILPSSTSSST
jgi:tetratricopeptide (TPR) repeat protein